MSFRQEEGNLIISAKSCERGSEKVIVALSSDVRLDAVWFHTKRKWFKVVYMVGLVVAFSGTHALLFDNEQEARELFNEAMKRIKK